MLSPDLEKVLVTMVSAAADTMMQLSGGAAVCTFTKSGLAVPGIKHAEGRWAALRELQRGLKKGAEIGELLASAQSEWQGKLETSIAEGANKDWLAYHHGGVDALADFAAQLEVENSPKP